MKKEAPVGTINKSNTQAFISKYAIVFVLLAMFIIMSIIRPNSFPTSANMANILRQTAITGIMALGMTFVIISKGIDISVGSMLAFVGVVMASLGQASDAVVKILPGISEMPVIVPILVSMILGGLLGTINGALIAYTKLPAMIATLGMMTIARGGALLFTNGQPVSNLLPEIEAIGGDVAGIPVPVIVYIVCIVIAAVILNYTRFGKTVFAIGANIKAAEVSGVPVKRNLTLIYTLNGIFVGIAAVVFAGRTGSVHPGAGVGFEMLAIASTTIGGTSHSGGVGTIWGAVVGALILSTVSNSLTLLSVNPNWQQVIQGVIIIGAVVVDMRKNAKR